MAQVVEFPNAMLPEDRARVNRALTHLEAEAAKWCIEAQVPGMVENVASIWRLNRDAPADVRDNFIRRYKEQIAAMIEQAFIEGAYRGCLGAFDAVRLGYNPEQPPPPERR